MELNGVGSTNVLNETLRIQKPVERPVEETKPQPREERKEPVTQERVEVRQRNTTEIPENQRIRERDKAEEIKNTVKEQMTKNPLQAITSQTTNISPERVANLL